MKKILLNAGQSPFGWHRYQAYMQCPLKYSLSYLLEEEREDSAPLVMGSLCHTGMAQHYGRLQATQKGKDPDSFYTAEEGMRLAAEEGGDFWIEHLDKCIEVVTKYQEDPYIKEWEDDLEVVHVEEFYTLKINEAPMTLRADLVVKLKSDNRIFIIDHKTTAYLRKQAIQGYNASGQFIAYSWAGKQLYGEQFGGLFFNFLQHGGNRKNGKIAFERRKMGANSGHHEAFPASVLYYWHAMQGLIKKGVPPKNWPRATTEFSCMHKYGKCPHYDRCLHE